MATPAVTSKLVADLSATEFEACSRLTLAKGEMRKRLAEVYELRGKPDLRQSGKRLLRRQRVLLVTMNGKLVAWALVFLGNTCHSHESPCPLVQMFVSPHYRRRGLGSILVREVMERWPRASFCPWDDRSRAFFAAQPQRLDYGFAYHEMERRREAPEPCWVDGMREALGRVEAREGLGKAA
jgi:GNAT superfamily N-acetyltransferase